MKPHCGRGNGEQTVTQVTNILTTYSKAKKEQNILVNLFFTVVWLAVPELLMYVLGFIG